MVWDTVIFQMARKPYTQVYILGIFSEWLVPFGWEMGCKCNKSGKVSWRHVIEHIVDISSLDIII